MGQHAEAVVQIRGRERRHAAFIPVGDPAGAARTPKTRAFKLISGCWFGGTDKTGSGVSCLGFVFKNSKCFLDVEQYLKLVHP